MRRRTVAIVGRPNVGKSTLFNRIIRRRQAIVDDMPGVTRDRLAALAEWNGVTFELVDTGGYVPNTKRELEQSVNDQIELSILEADAILFLLDVQTGITDLDQTVCKILRRCKKPVIAVINKVDNDTAESEAGVFQQLGLGEPSLISARDGRAMGDLLDRIVTTLQTAPDTEESEDPTELRVAIVGRPNVGKSSTVNAILKLPRMIVSATPGTTRDSVDSRVQFQGRTLCIIDTAGLRKKQRPKEAVEYYSNLRALRAIERCDVAVLLVDAEVGLETQDRKILEYCADKKKGIILAWNKWDLVEKDHRTFQEVELETRDALGMLQYILFLTMSALTHQRITRLLELCITVDTERRKRIPTSTLMDMITRVTQQTPPPTIFGKKATFKFCEQVSTAPPVMLFFTNHLRGIPTSYRRFLENRLRDEFGFEGVPLTLRFKKSPESKKRK